MPTDALLEVADELYALPLPEFTAARDARARALRTDPRLAARVKALRKPSLAAWVVNLLVRRDAGQVAQVLSLGAALREAQAGLAGEELRALTRQRRQLTAAVTARARALAAEHGQRVTEAVAEQVEATLTAAMVDAAAAQAVASGLLVAALTPAGVDGVDLTDALAVPAVDGHTATPLTGPDAAPRQGLHAVPDPDPDGKARDEARARVAAADAELTAARARLEAAEADVTELEARSLQVQAEIDELRRRIADLEAAAEAVDDELGDAEEVRAEAAAALERAARERAAAAAALAESGG